MLQYLLIYVFMLSGFNSCFCYCFKSSSSSNSRVLLAVPVSKELMKGQHSGDDALSDWNQQDTGTTSHMMNNKRKGSLHSLIHFCSINPQWDFTPPVTFFLFL